MYKSFMGLPRWLSGKESACQAEDAGSIPGSGRSSGERNGNPLQYSCLGNPMVGYSPWDYKTVMQDLTTKHQQQKLDKIYAPKALVSITRSFFFHKERK